jgi:N-formylglutamate deformylase
VLPFIGLAAKTKGGEGEESGAVRRETSFGAWDWSVGLDSEIAGVLYAKAPRGDIAPLVFDSPHSGTVDPVDFGAVAPPDALRNSRDSFVDDLFRDAPDYGAYLQAALFPRSYIDPNRSLRDIDPRMLDEPWPGPVTSGEKTIYGHGLVWRLCPPSFEMYDHKLSVAAVRRRIDEYWRPYHAHLSEAIFSTRRRFGRVWHLNCHSMPSGGAPGEGGSRSGQVDFVLGDRDGATCSPGFTHWVGETLRAMGYVVRVNDPYKGVELVRAYSDPAAGRHSLQIEINRAIYMDEVRCERNEGFEPLRADLGRLMAGMQDYARDSVAEVMGRPKAQTAL